MSEPEEAEEEIDLLDSMSVSTLIDRHAIYCDRCMHSLPCPWLTQTFYDCQEPDDDEVAEVAEEKRKINLC